MKMRKSDDVIGGSTKTLQHSIENNSRNISAVFFKLGTSNVHHKRNRMTSTMLLQCAARRVVKKISYDINTSVLTGFLPLRKSIYFHM